MEKTIHMGERTENVEEPFVVKSLEKDVLVTDIPDVPVKENNGDGDALVMIGAEIIDTQNEPTKEPRKGSGLVSIPTVLEKELQELLRENTVGEKKEGLEEILKKDRSMDDKAGIGEKVEEVEDVKQKKVEPAGEKEEQSEKKEGDDGQKEEKEKKETKGKDKEEKRKEKNEKEEKKKERKERKSRKSDVERIQKKLEKVHAKIERILAKKEEYLQRLAEAQEKERREKGRLAVEEATKQERDVTIGTKSSERSGETLPEAEVKQVEPLAQSSGKELDEEFATHIPTSNIYTSNKELSISDKKHPDEKLTTDQYEKVEGVKHT